VLATFVIFLREAIEASMIVAILLAYLDRIGQRRHFRDVFLGVGAALVLASAGAVVAYLTIRTYADSRVQTIFETVTYALAACLLTYMTIWMRRHARTISTDLRGRTEAALEGGQRLAIAMLAFQAVGREGLETAVFTLAIVFATHSSRAMGGAIPGLIIGLGIAVAIYHLGKRVNLGRFFNWLGALLIVFAAGLVADTVENLQQLGWVTIGTTPLWDTNGSLSEGSALGDIFHALFGYAGRPTVLQAVAYVTYLALAITVFVRSCQRAGGRARPQAAVLGGRVSGAADSAGNGTLYPEPSEVARPVSPPV
jgi:high-affinity iron transporter